MTQATANVKAMLRERLAGAQAEVALLQSLIEYLEGDPDPMPIRPPRSGQCRKRCTSCKKVHWVHGRAKHCPACQARNTLKAHDG